MASCEIRQHLKKCTVIGHPPLPYPGMVVYPSGSVSDGRKAVLSSALFVAVVIVRVEAARDVVVLSSYAFTTDV